MFSFLLIYPIIFNVTYHEFEEALQRRKCEKPGFINIQSCWILFSLSIMIDRFLFHFLSLSGNAFYHFSRIIYNSIYLFKINLPLLSYPLFFPTCFTHQEIGPQISKFLFFLYPKLISRIHGIRTAVQRDRKELTDISLLHRRSRDGDDLRVEHSSMDLRRLIGCISDHVSTIRTLDPILSDIRTDFVWIYFFIYW